MLGTRNDQVNRYYQSGEFPLVIRFLEPHIDNLSFTDKILLSSSYVKLEQKNHAKQIFDKINEIEIESIKTKGNIEQILLYAGICLYFEPKKFLHLMEYISNQINSVKNSSQKIAFETHLEKLWGDHKFFRSEYSKAVIHYDKAEKKLKKMRNKYLDYEVKINYGRIFLNLGKRKKAEKKFHEIYSATEKNGSNYFQAISLNYLGIIQGTQGNVTEAEKYFNKSLKINKNAGYDVGTAKVLNNLGNVYTIKGQHKKAIKSFEESIGLSKKHMVEENLVGSYINVGNIKKDLGEYEEALSYYRRGLPILDKTKNKNQLSKVYMNIGLIHKDLGEIKQAEYYQKKALGIVQGIGNDELLGRVLNSLGILLYIQTRYEEALKYYERALETFEKLDFSIELASVYLNIGSIYQKLSDYSRSQQYYNHSYQIRRKLGNDIALSEIIYQIILNELQFDYLDIAEKYLEELNKIADRTNNNLIQSRFKLAEASILQISSNYDEKTKAYEILEETLSNRILDFEMKVFAMINLCEFLILEYKYTQSEYIFQQLEYTLNKLYELAVDNESHELIAEVCLIQSKLSLVVYDTQQAVHYIKIAREISEANNIEQLKIKIDYIERNFRDRLYGLASEDEDLLDVINNLKIDDYIQNLYYQKEITNILHDDINKIRKLNLNLANILKLDKDLHKRMRGYAQLVELSSRELHITHSTLLLIDQLEKGELEPHYEDLDLLEFIEERFELFQLRIKNSSIQLQLPKIENKRKYITQSDRFIVGRILDNLILNSIKFTDTKGFVRVYLKKQDNKVQVIIDNECNPLDENILENVFDKYFQYYPDGIIRGFGIGLTFVKLAAELLKGDINIVSPIPSKDIGVRTVLTIPS